MFNALTKFANFLWKEDVPRRQSFSSSVDGVVVRSHSWERTKSCEENTRTFTGYISNLFGNHGLIDGDVYFSYSVVVGSQRPQVGNEVSVIASRQHREGGWYADQVSILKQWTEENDSGKFCVQIMWIFAYKIGVCICVYNLWVQFQLLKLVERCIDYLRICKYFRSIRALKGSSI